MTRQALLHLRVPVLDILEVTDGLRHERYGPAYSPRSPQNDLIARLGNLGRLLDFKWGTDRRWQPAGGTHDWRSGHPASARAPRSWAPMTETGFVASQDPIFAWRPATSWRWSAARNS